MWQVTTKCTLCRFFENKWNICSFVEIIKQAFQWYQTFINLKTYFWRYENKLVFISYYVFLYFISYSALYFKISLADIRYLLLWCVTFVSIHIKMMHLSGPTCSLFIAFIYLLIFIPWAGNSVIMKFNPLEYQWME